MIRLTIPITSNKEAPLQLAGDFVEMNPGECWYIDFTQPHQIQNSGASERINMSIDIIPNDWVKELIINN
jgi:mannose-6-phosphate isomerase-like protein (cupin superfamily)